MKLNSNFRNIRLILQFMFDSYRYDCRLNFINIEIDANEFSFKKENNDKNNDKRINENENVFEFFKVVAVF